MKDILKSYFYWTHPRGNVHYDVLVTLILLFIFITPHLWDYWEKPAITARLGHPIQVVSDGGRGVIVSLQASDIYIPEGATNSEVKRTLRRAVEPVTGDAVFVERWETAKDSDGNLIWKIWAHR